MKFIVVGIGGTGSYLTNNLINYLGVFKKVEHQIVLVDGDVLEERNLLRQGFLKRDIGKNKAEALKERFEKVLPEHITVESRAGFINSMKDLEDIVGDSTDVTIISCVDNNMARYRILMAQYKMFSESQGKKRFIFVDAGNEEWHGQVLVNLLKKGKASPIEYEEGKFIFRGVEEGHRLSTIFDSNDKWIETLSKGEHELSCEEITEAAPQNIVTNMTSAFGIIYMLNKAIEKGYNSTRFQFNIKKGIQEEFTVESNYDRVKDFVVYANGAGNRYLLGKEENMDGQDLYEEPGEQLEELLDSEQTGEDTDIREGDLFDEGIKREEENILSVSFLGGERSERAIGDYLESIGIDIEGLEIGEFRW